MAAASTAPTTTAATSTVLTAGNPRANGYAWPNSSSQQQEDPSYDYTVPTDDYSYDLRQPYGTQKSGVLSHTSPNIIDTPRQGRTFHSQEQGLSEYDASHRPLGNGWPVLEADVSSSGLPESSASTYKTYEGDHGIGAEYSIKRSAADMYSRQPDDESSKWIHRDKLARIESEELQAAGIILPKTRARSKQRRDASADTANGYRKPASDTDIMPKPRSRKNSATYVEHNGLDSTSPAWDLRLPEEIAEESYFVPLNGTRSISRIPVAKISPVPIPQEHMERDTPMSRRRDESPEESSIVYAKTRSRSASMKASDGSPASAAALSPGHNPAGSPPGVLSSKRPAATTPTGASGATSSVMTATRKTSAAARATTTSGRPRTRNGPVGKESPANGIGGGRPVTRSGEREVSAGASSRQPEGEPPWMISAYKPDPRLPPDQQLLPTVAKRLQQEKWEREGKFGNVYDKEFRPLTDEGFGSPPEAYEKTAGDNTAKATASAVAPAVAPAVEAAGRGGEQHPGWPLKPEARSQTVQPSRAGSYSTIPRIQERPNVSPLPSSRGQLPQTSGSTVIRNHAGSGDEADATSKKGCGCCLVM